MPKSGYHFSEKHEALQKTNHPEAQPSRRMIYLTFETSFSQSGTRPK